jgi:tetratricopeptide (TPR) repeat protein
LLGGVLEHFQTVVHLLKRAQPRESSQRLCSLAGEIAQILGKTLFDLHEYALAWAYYTFSIKAAQGASNHDLWAAGLGRMSLLLIYWEQPREALPLLQEAQQLTIQSVRIQCWLAAVEAEVYAHLDNANACDEALRTAKALTARESLGEDCYSTGFSPSRLAGYEGACFVRLHRPDRALPALQQALALLDPQAVRRQSTLFTDIGIVYAQQGNVREACKLARQALAITTNTKSRAVLERVRTLYKALEPWRETEEVKDLEEQLDTTLALITPGETS